MTLCFLFFERNTCDGNLLNTWTGGITEERGGWEDRWHVGWVLPDAIQASAGMWRCGLTGWVRIGCGLVRVPASELHFLPPPWRWAGSVGRQLVSSPISADSGFRTLCFQEALRFLASFRSPGAAGLHDTAICRGRIFWVFLVAQW